MIASYPDAPPAAPTPSTPRFFLFATIVLVFVLLYVGREVFIPIALAIFLAFVLSRIAGCFERSRLGRIGSVVLTIFIALLALGGLAGLIAYQGSVLVEQIPQYRSNIREKVSGLQTIVGGWFGAAVKTVSELQHELTNSSASAPTTQSAGRPVDVNVVGKGADGLALSAMAFQVVGHPLITLSIAFIFTVFFLIDRDNLRDRLLRLLGEANLNVSTNALNDAAERVSHYLGALALANAIAGGAVAIGLLIIGVPNWLLWGCLTAILRFIPFVGPLLAAAFPIVLSVAASDSWLQPLLFASWFLTVDLLSANLLEPVLYGTRSGASPTAVIFSFILWTWLWGPYGLFLATPITVCLVALGRHVSQLEFFATLLGDQPVFRPSVRLYQRLLAADAAAAREVIAHESKELEPLALFDRVVAPAVGRVTADWAEGLIGPARHQRTMAALEVALADTTTGNPNGDDPAAAAITPAVILWSAGSEFEDALLPTIHEILDKHGIPVAVCTSNLLVSDVDGLIQEQRPTAVILVAGTLARAKRAALLRRRWTPASAQPSIHALILDREQRPLATTRRWGAAADAKLHASLGEVLPALSSAAFMRGENAIEEVAGVRRSSGAPASGGGGPRSDSKPATIAASANTQRR